MVVDAALREGSRNIRKRRKASGSEAAPPNKPYIFHWPIDYHRRF